MVYGKRFGFVRKTEKGWTVEMWKNEGGAVSNVKTKTVASEQSAKEQLESFLRTK